MHTNRVDGEDVTVLWERRSDVWVDWEAFRIAGWDGSTRLYRPDFSADLAQADRFCSGYLKWDGCNEWAFHEDHLHFCEPQAFAEAVTEVARIVQTVGYQQMSSPLFYLPEAIPEPCSCE